MPDRELIHSSADVRSILLFALDSGLRVMVDSAETEPRPRMLERDDVSKTQKGVFYLFRPEWVFGSFEFIAVSGGYNRGKFIVKPRVNFSPITAYFSGERIKHGRRRLGAGVVSYHRDWLEMPAKVLHPTVPEVGDWYKRIVSHVSTRIVVKAGVHRYEICRGVIEDPNAADCMPPFEFIPWGSEVLNVAPRTKVKKKPSIAQRSKGNGVASK